VAHVVPVDARRRVRAAATSDERRATSDAAYVLPMSAMAAVGRRMYASLNADARAAVAARPDRPLADLVDDGTPEFRAMAEEGARRARARTVAASDARERVPRR
jgi:hypothetical protein